MPLISTQLLIIGGGATGLGIAWDACLRGLKVVLVEQNDLGQGTSGRYHGVLHSGARYVVSDPISARDCAVENQIIRRIAPHMIEDTGGFYVTTPDDPEDFSDQWFAACKETGVPAEEITLSTALRHEPAINPHISRAFRVKDASLDSFDLLHALMTAINRSGGQVWLRHQVERLVIEKETVVAAVVTAIETGEKFTIGADLIINAAGPWANLISNMAGIDLPILLGKGSMIAFASRPIHTIINRCRPPDDGDIIVPIGTVAVVGTTELEVRSPADLVIEPWEIDFLLAQGEILVPGLTLQRPLRAWAGIRPFYRPKLSEEYKKREIPRTHNILDHADRDGLEGLVSIIGGKLTTFRLMAEHTVDLVCNKMGIASECRTADTPLEPLSRSFHRLPARLEKLIDIKPTEPPGVICECELATRSMLEESLLASPRLDLDDVRRDLRLGMGPCQAGFCAYRAAGVASEVMASSSPNDGLEKFLVERWRGIRPLGWGHTLRQMELTRRIYVELLGTGRQPEVGG